MKRADSLEKPDAGKDWWQKEKGVAEDEMVREHHQLKEQEFEQSQGDIEILKEIYIYFTKKYGKGISGSQTKTPILWPPDVNSWLIGKDSDAGKDGRQKEKGVAEDEMVRKHH